MNAVSKKIKRLDFFKQAAVSIVQVYDLKL